MRRVTVPLFALCGYHFSRRMTEFFSLAFSGLFRWKVYGCIYSAGGRLLSLTPRFSGVFGRHGAFNRFSGFSERSQASAEKTAEAVQSTFAGSQHPAKAGC
jgi:hypothetical protein